MIVLALTIIGFLFIALAAVQGSVKDYGVKWILTVVIIIGVSVSIVLTIMQYKESDDNASETSTESTSTTTDKTKENTLNTTSTSDEDANNLSTSNFMEPEPEYVLLNDMHRIEESKVYIDSSATTTWGDDWLNCMRLGSSNLNADGISYLSLPCKGEYSRFTAEIAPEDGFDSAENVTLTIYGQDADENYVELGGTYEIGAYTKPFTVDFDISSCDLLIIYKNGNYSTGRIAGQFLNGYTGMSVLIKDGKLYRK